MDLEIKVPLSDIQSWMEDIISNYNSETKEVGSITKAEISEKSLTFTFGIKRLQFSHIAKLVINGSVVWTCIDNGHTFGCIPYISNFVNEDYSIKFS